MAQPGTVKVAVDVDTRAARRSVRAIRSLAQEADRALARLEEGLEQWEAAWAAKLAEYGIQLEIEEGKS